MPITKIADNKSFVYEYDWTHIKNPDKDQHYCWPDKRNKASLRSLLMKGYKFVPAKEKDKLGVINDPLARTIEKSVEGNIEYGCHVLMSIPLSRWKEMEEERIESTRILTCEESEVKNEKIRQLRKNKEYRIMTEG